MALFQKKTCEDYVTEIRNILQIIADMPNTEDAIIKAHALAKRGLQQLKKIADLDASTSKATENQLRLIIAAEEYRILRPQAIAGLYFIEQLEKFCAERLESKGKTTERIKLKRGKTETYGRMMSTAEYKRLKQVKVLESAEETEMIPAFNAPTGIVEYFLKIDKTAIRNIYSLIGGTGAVDYLVFFRTNVVPTIIGMPRRWPKIIEVKFPNGTPIELIAERRI